VTADVQIVLPTPTGSGRIGTHVAMLPNGNFVVTDPEFDAPGGLTNAGAIRLYRRDLVLLSTLHGTSNDRLGSGGIVLTGSGALVFSPDYSTDLGTGFGAVSFISATGGPNGQINASNSLLGTATGDRVGSGFAALLSNGNFVVLSPQFGSGGIATSARGAATFGSGQTGVAGLLSASNSLVGNPGDRIASGGVLALSDGAYVVISPLWSSPTATLTGAVTWGSGLGGVAGSISGSNSLIGSSSNDQVGSGGVFRGVAGRYVVSSPLWDRPLLSNAGAATRGGAGGVVGAISIDNSIIGAPGGSTDRQVSSGGITVLGDGDFIVQSPLWDSSVASDVGAATFAARDGSGFEVSASNSLIGSVAGSRVGTTVVELNNGDYVVASPQFASETAAAIGAVTRGNGVSGSSGILSSSNSLVGSTAQDRVGSNVTALTDGGYVVGSPNWTRSGISQAGASTYGAANTGIVGVVSVANSLVGSSAGDRVGFEHTELRGNPLGAGTFLTATPHWRNGNAQDAGAVTLSRPDFRGVGAVTSGNSAVGTTTGDQVSRVISLDQGDFVIAAPLWDGPGVVDAGIATLFQVAPLSGPIENNVSNLRGGHANARIGINVVALPNGSALIGSPHWGTPASAERGWLYQASGSGFGGIAGGPFLSGFKGSSTLDRVGSGGVKLFSNGDFVVVSPEANRNSVPRVGAITVLPEITVGVVLDLPHTVYGGIVEGGAAMRYDYDPLRWQLIVGDPAANRVTVLRRGIPTTMGALIATPNPVVAGQAINALVTVSHPTAAPRGLVRFSGGGQECRDLTATPAGKAISAFSCSLSFPNPGVYPLVAELIPDRMNGFGFSISAPVNIEVRASDVIFANGFQ
jgi:hypothetical protein